MKLDELKKTFIKRMEEFHSPEGYPRNFFGCLSAILIDDAPVTQDRIIELTGYSRAAVSLALQKLQLLLPVRVSKKVGDRKHYYLYHGSIEGLLVDIMRRRADVPDIDLDLIRDIMKKIEPFLTEHTAYVQFYQYLKNLDFFIRFLSAKRKAALEQFDQYLDAGGVNGLIDSTLSDEVDAEFAKLLKKIITHRREKKECPSSEHDLIPHYMEMKKEYFQGILNTFNPIYSKAMANVLIVVHDILIEECTMQAEIQQATQLPRSTISECISLAVEQNLVQFQRMSGSRTKFYRPKLSLTEILLRYYDRAIRYTVLIKDLLSDLLANASGSVVKDNESMIFIQKLNNLMRVYTIAQSLAKQTKRLMIEEILERAENSFEFV